MERIWYIKRIGREDKFSVCVKAGVPVGLSAWCGRAVCFSSCCGEGGKAYIKEGRTDRCYAIRKTGKCCCRPRRYRSLRPLGRNGDLFLSSLEPSTGVFSLSPTLSDGRNLSCGSAFHTTALFSAFKPGRRSDCIVGYRQIIFFKSTKQCDAAQVTVRKRIRILSVAGLVGFRPVEKCIITDVSGI